MNEADRQAEFERIVRVLIELGAQRIILFGSRAREDHHPESDFDLLVVIPDDESLPYARRLARVYEAVVPRIAVDILVYSPAEFAALVRERPFLRRAVAEGRELHGA